MKRIVSALLIASALLTGYAEAKLEKVQPKEEETKVTCTIGLEGEGSFTEVYKNKKECRQYCKGGATVCEETGIETPINTEEVD